MASSQPPAGRDAWDACRADRVLRMGTSPWGLTSKLEVEDLKAPSTHCPLGEPCNKQDTLTHVICPTQPSFPGNRLTSSRADHWPRQGRSTTCVSERQMVQRTQICLLEFICMLCPDGLGSPGWLAYGIRHLRLINKLPKCTKREGWRGSGVVHLDHENECPGTKYLCDLCAKRNIFCFKTEISFFTLKQPALLKIWLFKQAEKSCCLKTIMHLCKPRRLGLCTAALRGRNDVQGTFLG